jgi:hypothetical protein
MSKLVAPKKPNPPRLVCKPDKPTEYYVKNDYKYVTYLDSVGYNQVIDLLEKNLVSNGYEVYNIKEEFISIEIEQDSYGDYSKAELLICYNGEVKRKKTQLELDYENKLYEKNLNKYKKDLETYKIKYKEYQEKNKVYLKEKKEYDRLLSELDRENKIKLFNKLKKELGET